MEHLEYGLWLRPAGGPDGYVEGSWMRTEEGEIIKSDRIDDILDKLIELRESDEGWENTPFVIEVRLFGRTLTSINK